MEVWFLTSLKLIVQVEMQSEKKYLWDISPRPVEKKSLGTPEEEI